MMYAIEVNKVVDGELEKVKQHNLSLIDPEHVELFCIGAGTKFAAENMEDSDPEIEDVVVVARLTNEDAEISEGSELRISMKNWLEHAGV